MLKRHIDIGQDSFGLCDCPQKWLVDVHRVEVHQADPIKSFDLIELFKEFSQTGFTEHVDAIVRRILCDDDQFAYAGISQSSRLDKDILHRLAGVFAPHFGDGTESAETVTTFGDFEVCEMFGGDLQSHMIRERPDRGRSKDRALFIQTVHDSVDKVSDFIASENADQPIDIRAFGQKAIILTFGKASGDHHSTDFSRAFQFEHLVDGFERLLSGVFDESAGIDDDKVRFFRVLHQLVATLLEDT